MLAALMLDVVGLSAPLALVLLPAPLKLMLVLPVVKVD